MSFRPIAAAILMHVVLIAFTACNTTQENPPGFDDMAGVPFTRDVSMDTCVVLIGQALNLCDWKVAEAVIHEERDRHSIHVRETYKGYLDSNLIVSLSAVAELSAAQDFVSSEVYMAPLNALATDHKVKAIFLDQQLEYTKETNDTLVMYMSFKTLSYERWEEAFLADYREDQAKDFEVIRVFKGIEDPDHVHMMFKVNDPLYVEKMEKNNAFRMKMLAAGVVSYPVTYKLFPANG